jgi:hypothetical protein
MPSRAFAIYGVPDGEYELFAQSFSSSQGGSKSHIRRIQVKGADVTGIELSLAPTGSISGLVTVEALADASVKQACKKSRSLPLEENLFAVIKDDKTEEGRPVRTLIPVSRDLVPGDKGEFQLKNIDAGRYRFETRSVGDSLYIRSITLASQNKNSPPQDVSTNGLNVKTGEQVKGLTIALAEGGASIEGQVVHPAANLAPSAVRVYLIPADRENKDNLLRYAETAAGGNGHFKLTNIAPGKYWMLAKPSPEPEMSGAPVRPAIRDVQKRNALRKEAEVAKLVVELKSCQKITDYALRVMAH